MKETWKKIFEYASMPVHGTLSISLFPKSCLRSQRGPVYCFVPKGMCEAS